MFIAVADAQLSLNGSGGSNVTFSVRVPLSSVATTPASLSQRVIPKDGLLKVMLAFRPLGLLHSSSSGSPPQRSP
jgi:hypothetical protein